MATMLYRKQRAEINFADLMTTILTWVTRSVKIGLGRWEPSIAGSFGRGWYPIAKNAYRAIEYFSSSHFHCGYMPWGRFKISENECRMNWKIGRWSNAKTHAKFCLPDKKESRSCIGLWQTMKNEPIFRILNARNLGLIPPNHQHLPQDQIVSDRRRRCAFGGIRRVSSTTSC